MQRIKDGGKAVPSTDSLGEYLLRFVKLPNERGIRVKDRLKEISPESEDYPLVLALGMVDHDFRGIADLFQLSNAILLMRKGGVKDINEILEDPKYFWVYENIRVGLTALSYLATGDKNFLVQVDSGNVPDLLRVMNSDRIKCSYDFGKIQAISSDQYIAIHQLVKNAWKKVQNNGVIDETIEVRLKETYSQMVVTVKDNGAGISDDKLPIIFGNYTEGGTGIGLQIVKRIMDLRKGHIEAVSTVPEGGTFRYDTKSNTTVKIGEHQPQGTAFTLYFPKV